MNPLAELRDIHLPPPPGLWPLAMGWWLVSGLILLLFVLILVVYIRRYPKIKIKRQARRALNELKNNPDADLINEVTTLLKRVAISYYPQQEVAHLHGEQWLEFLDKTGRTRAFTHGVGRFFAAGHYQRRQDINDKTLLKLARFWLRRIR